MRTSDESPQIEKLTELMKRRIDGDWELLAAAVGQTSSVSNLLQALSHEALSSDMFQGPDLAFRRVEALAAFDIVPLVLIAEYWPLPGELQSNGSTNKLGCLVEAWRAALRFLPEKMQRQVLGGAVPTALEEEKRALLSPVPDFKSWEELVAFVENTESSVELRMTDRARFPVSAVPKECLEALLEIPPRGRWGPFGALRVLRRVASVLDDPAKSQVLDLAGIAWMDFSADEGQLILFELAARAIDEEAWVRELAVAQVTRALESATNPLPLLRAAYVTADTGFMMP